MPRWPTRQPQPFQVYYFATCYHKSARRLAEQKPLAAYAVGSVVYEALALEVFLKCLYRVLGRDIPRHHDVKKMFQGLDRKNQQLIRDEFATFATREIGPKHKLKLLNVLTRSRHLFEITRYGYEPGAIPRNSSTTPVNPGLNQAVKAVQSAILKYQPSYFMRAKIRHGK